ncbi:MAG: nicotinate-nucleotide adenylyltransferase [Rhodospirillaceae bacterium]
MTAKFGRDIPPFGDRRRRRVGLLGGSFNPAHDGHRHLSLEALKHLRLDQVWWLVSPQNPLKSSREMGTLNERLARARQIASHPKILATDVERRLGTTRTARTLALLTARYPNIAFVWLMGSDNLVQVRRWWRWTQIFRACRVAVFDRSPYSYKALAGAAARRFNRIGLHRFWSRPLPVWTYVAMRRHPASATAIRNNAAKD